jgi:hypothetical protein
VTPAGAKRGGARAWRLVTATPGQLGHQPAGTMTGARGASLEMRDDAGGEPAAWRPPHEAWPELRLWDE